MSQTQIMKVADTNRWSVTMHGESRRQSPWTQITKVCDTNHESRRRDLSRCNGIWALAIFCSYCTQTQLNIECFLTKSCRHAKYQRVSRMLQTGTLCSSSDDHHHQVESAQAFLPFISLYRWGSPVLSIWGSEPLGLCCPSPPYAVGVQTEPSSAKLHHSFQFPVDP